jgi:ABC-type antimicrobial peptide transport system permease subunit
LFAGTVLADSQTKTNSMFKNYLKIALRVLIRQKSYAVLNILGLTFGLVGFIIIFLIVRDELSYDRSNKKLETLYVMGQDQFYGENTYHFMSMPPPLKSLLVETIPEITAATRFSSQNISLTPSDQSFNERVTFADAAIFNMLTFDMAEGDANHPLKGVYTMSISEKIAQKLFKGESALGKTLMVRNEFDFTITSVFEDLPYNVSYRPEIVIPFSFLEKLGMEPDVWGNNQFNTLVALDENANLTTVNEKVKDILKEKQESTAELFLHPLKDLHLHNLRYKGGSIEYVYIFIVIGLSILLLACINFMNMATARSVKRSKEIGVRKAIGAVRSQVMLQFFGESILLALISLNFAVLMVEFFLPTVNLLTNKHLFIDYGNIVLLASFLLIGIITGALAGAYPALYLSSFTPVAVLRSIVNSGTGSKFRKALVVFQFAISVTLIICTSIVYSQLNFLITADIGMDREHIIYFPTGNKVVQNMESFRTELNRLPLIEAISQSTHLPNSIYSNGGGWGWDGKDPEYDLLISMTSSDEYYAEVFGIEMAEGRYFDAQIASDSIDKIVINQQLAELIGWDQSVGQSIIRENGQAYEVIGVAKDFNINDLRSKIPPLMIFFNVWDKEILSIRVTGDEKLATNAISDIYKDMFPDTPVELTPFQQNIEDQYKREQKLGDVFKYFAILAVIISCLGLYGLSTFMAEQRKKEMGIRKTLGASASLITRMMLSDFTRWVIIANIIAWPIAWYIADQWLEKFAFHISFGWWTFVVAGMSSLLIAVFTVMFQSIKTAMANPVYALKDE